jgi:photosynthetic reaction center cytochrome c subunit
MSRLSQLGAIACGLIATVLLQGCERPPIKSTQNGYRGTAMVQVVNPRTAAEVASRQTFPAALPAVPDEGPRARELFKNVQVLGDLSAADFLRHMTAIQSWVAPKADCSYCHDLANLADDGKYTKVVARRMLQMTRSLNTDWKQHTMAAGATGVTCFTCHRGNPIPQYTWSMPKPGKAGVLLGDDAGQNKAATSVGLTSLPYDAFSAYLSDNKKVSPIRVYGPSALLVKGGEKWGTMKAEHSYGLMMSISSSLGVNCTFCHDTSNFQSWTAAPPQRVNAWHGIRMVGDINANYITPLTSKLPADRLGPMGDAPKAYCATCHQGVNKPLAGAQMAKDYVGLITPVKLVAALPPPTDEPLRSVLYFNVGSAVLHGEQSKGLAQLVATMTSTPRAQAIISGYHSASGELAANHELAKQRAFTVRDAMLAAGVPEARVVLSKPQQTEANLHGEDPAARRVEVTLK